MGNKDASNKKAANVEKLREMGRLVPNQGISVNSFEFMYPGECYIVLIEKITNACI
jgi:hypothetical protein